MWAALVAGKGTVPEDWVQELPVEQLAPLLRRIVREDEAAVAPRNTARSERWAAGRDSAAAAAPAGKT